MKGSKISSSDSSLLIYTIIGLHKREQIVNMISSYPDEMVDIFILSMPCMDYLIFNLKGMHVQFTQCDRDDNTSSLFSSPFY